MGVPEERSPRGHRAAIHARKVVWATPQVAARAKQRYRRTPHDSSSLRLPLIIQQSLSDLTDEKAPAMFEQRRSRPQLS